MKENPSPVLAAWRWRKSSFSEPNGGECIELGWRKPSFSEPNGGNCVEVAAALDAVRDSKNPAGPILTVPTLATLLTHLKAGRFSR